MWINAVSIPNSSLSRSRDTLDPFGFCTTSSQSPFHNQQHQEHSQPPSLPPLQNRSYQLNAQHSRMASATPTYKQKNRKKPECSVEKVKFTSSEPVPTTSSSPENHVLCTIPNARAGLGEAASPRCRCHPSEKASISLGDI
jgi:hypothetical protein